MQENIKSITVSQLNRYVFRLLGNQSVLQNISIVGELSNVKVYSSGHWYFNLKDQNAQVSCVMFKSAASSLNFRPKDGDAVILSGKVSLYERDGKFQVYVNKMDLDGKGNLYLLFEQLNKKLQAEGLYSEEFKKPIPKFPKVIGVATSRSGAVIQDIINVSRRRWPLSKIVLAPCSVQGENAAPTIVKSIEKLNEMEEVDVIIVGRGGGSLEDLWAFNEESVARAVFASEKPIISAVGHESDTTICDYVADLRAPTPSAAAEVALPNINEVLEYMRSKELQMSRLLSAKVDFSETRLFNLEDKLKTNMVSIIKLLNQKLSHLSENRFLLNPYENLDRKKEAVDINADKLEQRMTYLLKNKEQSLARKVASLDALSPLKVLGRGYSMLTRTGESKPLVSAQDIRKNEALDVFMQDGKLKVEVLDVSIEKEGK
ncbi:exodeoxyribonuclease VII large subunit [Fastidiosipila sanguinis]|uniref:Exodeoxyribonuclease 7 large subunit n=1 Tax=Fastidiosipila sanguinis TaxID=236753 RepID=A0A2S0KMU4_9FIRM|nr:exodeoxyribonuclease VII large subunit [Fastidiosipila sanguinis]AVM42355.1 exodeoxyribonuclease VII large subunit [Fastidiosipila sanguinis]